MALTKEELRTYAVEHAILPGEPDVMEADCAILEYLFENCTLGFHDRNPFFVTVNTYGIMESVYRHRGNDLLEEKLASDWYKGRETKVCTGTWDFGHTCAQWENVIPGGIVGLKARLDRYAETNTDPQKARFYRICSRVHAAALKFIARAAAFARENGRTQMADGLDALTRRAPETLYEALQTSLIFYTLQQHFEGTHVRSMGRLDALLLPYWQKEEPEQAAAMLLDFVNAMDSYQAVANLPFALGGTNPDGSTMVNPLSYALLDAYRQANTTEVKIHILCGETMPSEFLRRCLDSIRQGKNSLVFISDRAVTSALTALGLEPADAANYHVVGCYEPGGKDELPSSCNCWLNILKPLEQALNGGRDMVSGEQVGPENDGVFPTFEDLYHEFERQLQNNSEIAMNGSDFMEKDYPNLHSAPFLSATYDSAVEAGGDLYCHYSAKYCNSSLNAAGLATTADSLTAIRKLVYEDKTMTLAQLIQILKNDWADEEILRQRIRRRFPKYGQGCNEADTMAASVAESVSKFVNGRPNVKGGVYRASLLSIDNRWSFGARSAASADGRKKGEVLSQNTSATFGADRMGATAHLLSAARLNYDHAPDGAVVDIDLHGSAVAGENGLTAMEATLRTYFDMGGFAVHYNVLDAATLREARDDPEKHPGLQVRLCGWNALFSTLTAKEKDDFISRWENREAM